MVGLFWDLSAALVARLRAAGIVVVCQIGSPVEAAAAERAGAQALIAQGCEAGGHVRGTAPLDVLLPDVVAAAGVPVLAAGGIIDGAGLVAALALGAQGAVLGTALMATRESFAHDYHKQRLVEAGDGDAVLTQAFHVNWPRGATVRVLGNSVTRGERGDPFTGEATVIGAEEGRPIRLFSTDSPLRSTTGDLEAMALYAGMAVGGVNDIPGAGGRLRGVVSAALDLLDVGVPAAIEPVRPASPACAAHEMEDGYMGYAGRDDLLAALNELIEAERAGARVARHLAVTLDEPGPRALMAEIHRDEARWCGVLTSAVQALGGDPSTATGAFYAKVMALDDPGQRVALLDRGQRWVIRRLGRLLPTIRDDGLHARLSAILAAHERNVLRVGAHRPAAGPDTLPPAGGAIPPCA